MKAKEKILESLMAYEGDDFIVTDDLLGFIRSLDVEDDKPEIVYLNPDSLWQIEYETDEQRDNIILNHPDSAHYSLEDFIDDFNAEVISDLGVLVFKKRLNYERILFETR